MMYVFLYYIHVKLHFHILKICVLRMCSWKRISEVFGSGLLDETLCLGSRIVHWTLNCCAVPQPTGPTSDSLQIQKINELWLSLYYTAVVTDDFFVRTSSSLGLNVIHCIPCVLLFIQAAPAGMVRVRNPVTFSVDQACWESELLLNHYDKFFSNWNHNFMTPLEASPTSVASVLQ